MSRTVVITSNTLGFGGAERQRVGLANGLVARGWSVEFRVLQETGPLEASLDSRVVVRVFGASASKSARAALGTRGSVLLTGTTLTEVAHGLLAAVWPLKNWWVVASHNPTNIGSKTYPALPGFLMKFARRWVVLSQTQSDVLIGMDGFIEKRVRIIPNGIDTVRFLGISRQAAKDQPFRFGFVGRLTDQKGLDLLLEALLECQDIPWSLTVSGEGPAASLEGAARYAPIANRVIWVGGRDASETFAEIDLLIVPSRNEAYPLVLLEAMVAGVPILTTDVGANVQILDGHQGRIILDTSPEAFAIDLRSAVADIDELSRQATAAVDNATEDFSLAKMVERYESVLLEGVNK
jgi:glycosyltransferase involved in cell wall biosynthesis